MRKTLRASATWAGLLSLIVALSACSQDAANDAAKADASAPAERVVEQVVEKKNKYLYEAREAPTGEFDDADAKLVFRLRGCNACHEVEAQRIGPPYRAIALRYATAHAEDAKMIEQALAMKIRLGGAGAWGNVPMVSHPAIDQEEAESIARWIMRLQEATAEP